MHRHGWGLDISIDSLNRETFKNLTGHDRLPEILAGIKILQNLNFKSIKVNAVLLKGINDTEKDFEAFANFIKENKIDFRFIELMETGESNDFFKKNHVPAKIFKDYLEKNNWIYQTHGKDAGPALNYMHPEFKSAEAPFPPEVGSRRGDQETKDVKHCSVRVFMIENGHRGLFSLI